MTVGELKKCLADMPDEAVLWCPKGASGVVNQVDVAYYVGRNGQAVLIAPDDDTFCKYLGKIVDQLSQGG